MSTVRFPTRSSFSWAARSSTTVQYATLSEHLHPFATRTLLRDSTVHGLSAAAMEHSIFLAYDQAAYGVEYGGVRRAFGRLLPKARFAD